MKLAYSYHLVTNSPWPFTTSFSLFSTILGIISLISNQGLLTIGIIIISISTISLIFSLYFWWYDVIIESTYKGEHTEKVQKGITMGFILFVISEISIFISLFFTYFYNALIPSIEVGGLWPPVGIITLDYKSVPLLNTLILLCSGFSITACHNYIINKQFSNSFFFLFLTILLGSIFTYFQYFEYFHSFFTITDSIFGSSFFILTGCHALHIIIGSIMLIISLLRFSLSHFTNFHHLNFSFSAIYWHFVDAIWLLLYLIIYCWSA